MKWRIVLDTMADAAIAIVGGIIVVALVLAIVAPTTVAAIVDRIIRARE